MSILLGARRRAVLVTAACGLRAVPFAATSFSALTTPTPAKRTFIVQFVPGANPVAQALAIIANGGSVRVVLRSAFRGAIVDLTPRQAEALRRNRNVAFVEADAPVTAYVVQQPGPTYGLDRIDQRDRPLSTSFDYGTTGEGVTAYIVDTGLRADHTEFTGRVQEGSTVINDGNGTGDCNGHGTHVAGTVAGTTYGVAKEATVVPVRVLDCLGRGSNAGIVAGLESVIGHHLEDTPAVVNMSLGGGRSPAVDTQVNNAVHDGITVAVAAGNANGDACDYSPAGAPLALTVGATDSTDTRASYSNSGPCLDLFAPGTAITSAWHTGASATHTISGTSMASPHVAGAVAALLESDPTMTPKQVAGRLADAATLNRVADAAGSLNRLLFSDPLLVPASVQDKPDLTPPSDTPSPPSPPVPPPVVPVPGGPGVPALPDLSGLLSAILGLLAL